MEMVEARYYEKKDNDRVRCRLCPRFCVIEPSQSGTCMLRSNVDGKLYASEYGKTVALNIDPIEKKPLYHFKPGKDILSVGPNGCNFSCEFCQNWSISQDVSYTRYASPSELVKLAGSNNSIGVAFTYTEPLVWFEYVYDSARLLKEAGLATVIVSNGFICEEPARELFEHIDAANFDLKSIRDDFYRRLCDGRLSEVQDTIRLAVEMGVHVELTNLLLPGENDSDDDIRDLVDWIAELDSGIVLHISRYFPSHRFSAPPTPPNKLKLAHETARKKLKYVYTGNISGIGDPDTRCAKCGEILVARSGYSVTVSGLDGVNCAGCGTKSDFVV
ncbi:MAG: AmmeMemoRadiSam system radical SAM enzyme [candidate division Zixibacteria bacterium]